MRLSLRTIHFLLLFAASTLVLNDVARLVFPALQGNALTYSAGGEEEKKDDSNPTNTLFEEEVKHKDIREIGPLPFLFVDAALDAATIHLISDDDVRHQAFIPIFTPPPDRA